MPNVETLLRDHVTLQVDCVDRLYLNGYVPSLQRPEQAWRPGAGRSFRSFAQLVIRRRLSELVRGALREKHRPLSEAARVAYNDRGELVPALDLVADRQADVHETVERHGGPAAGNRPRRIAASMTMAESVTRKRGSVIVRCAPMPRSRRRTGGPRDNSRAASRTGAAVTGRTAPSPRRRATSRAAAG